MKSFKGFLEERTNREIADDVLKIDDKGTLNRIDSVLSVKLFEEKLDLIFDGKKLPRKSETSIKSFFETHRGSIEDKLSLLEALENGIITTNPSSGYYRGVKELITNKAILKNSIFEDFCEFAGALGDSKEGQGNTGTGKGEILIVLLTKDGKLPTSSGDINIFGQGLEVKASNGIIATFLAYKDTKKTDSILKKYYTGKEKEIKLSKRDNNLKGLVKELNTWKDKDSVKKFIEAYYKKRAKDSFVKKLIEDCVKGVDFTKPLTPKQLQTAFGIVLTRGYQNAHNWKGILIFKDSKGFLNTPLSLSRNISEFGKYISFSGLNMTNGKQDAVLPVTPKNG